MNVLFEQMTVVAGSMIPSPIYLTSPIIVWVVSLTVDVFIMADGKSDFLSELNNVDEVSVFDSLSKLIKMIPLVFCYGVSSLAGVSIGAYFFTQDSRYRTRAIFLIALTVFGIFIIFNLKI